MKHIQLLTLSLILGFSAYGQNYNDLFTTYKNTTNQQNSGVTQYQTIDPNQFYQFIATQNIQTVNGIFIYQGQFYSIKLRVGISGTDPNQTVVCGFWDGQRWHDYTTYASKISTYGVPEQIRMACTHQVNISSIGIVYF